jgi:hypothetical protein
MIFQYQVFRRVSTQHSIEYAIIESGGVYLIGRRRRTGTTEVRPLRISPPSDGKGASERIWVRVPPQLFRQLRVVVGSKKFPFRTVGDFVRVACYRLAKELLAKEDGIPDYTQQIDSIRELVWNEEMNADFLGMFDQLNRIVMNFQQQQSIGQARKLIAQTRARIILMPEGFWKDRYLSELDTKFGHLLK